MSRILSLAFFAAAASALALPAFATDAYTTRIEPRPYYGATVTIEEGVRVFRPLPPQKQVIINPGGQTPLNLGFNDTRVTETSTSNNYYYDNRAPAPAVRSGGAYYYAPYGYRHRH